MKNRIRYRKEYCAILGVTRRGLALVKKVMSQAINSNWLGIHRTNVFGSRFSFVQVGSKCLNQCHHSPLCVNQWTLTSVCHIVNELHAVHRCMVQWINPILLRVVGVSYTQIGIQSTFIWRMNDILTSFMKCLSLIFFLYVCVFLLLFPWENGGGNYGW